ncbi:MAG: sigma 54-interacting transcriptional regulator [Myxococcales bacterium]|nr:sigma 54-interacting transcriptional regulator [Myxococcales bacterium]
MTQAGPSGRRASVRVAVLREARSGTEIPLAEERRYVIGKGESCDIVLPDPCVSRVHCVLERHGGSLFVRDSGSRNGTYINDRRIECAELTPGTTLTVGLTQLVALGPPGQARAGFDRLIGRDPSLRAAVEIASRAAGSECSVLIVGETGTGKDVVAQAIHERSRRSSGPFVPLNCGAIPRELIGSELFGHDRGAFTGAVGDRDGVFVQADRGTLFLDELGELPMEQQPHLLRAIETRRVRRVGGTGEEPFDARLIAATNRESGLGSERGALRVDLYHRVATVVVRLPPLRARPGDLDELCGAFLEELARAHGPRRLSAGARRALREHAWPGNVRELRQAIVRAVTFSAEVIDAEHLFPTAWRQPLAPAIAPIGPGLVQPDGPPVALPTYEVVVRDAMLEALSRHGSIRAAAEALGMAKSTFADRARKLGIKLPQRGRP